MFKIIGRFILIEMIAVMMMASFGGCSEVMNKQQSLTFNLGSEPETVDPALNTAVDGANVILACFEGLMRLDKNNKAVPGIAAFYTKDSDVKYTFRLREAKWSDGKPVTAVDFEYAWKRVLAPETSSEYAYQLYYIKNGEAYNKKRTTADNLGIKVINDKTIEITLESASPYFLELLALPPYMPVRKDIFKSNPDKWAANPATYIGNGPFKMTAWRKKDAIEFTKNDNYYDADRIKLNRLIFRMVEEPYAYLSSWENGDMDIIESPPASEIPRLKSENKLTISPYLGTYFYAFNNRVKPLNDKRVRRALAFAVDRHAIIQNVARNEALPASAFVPNGIADADIAKDFRDVGGIFIKSEAQVAEAQNLLADAGYPDGKNFPSLTLMYNNTGSHGAVAQAIQAMWKKNLNINVNLQVQEWKVLQEKRSSGNYDIARSGWMADYTDPMTFLDIFESSSGNNNSGYSSKMFDDLIHTARKEGDLQKRMDILHDGERILMSDMPILPIYFYTNPVCIKPYVKNVIKSPLGFVYFDMAYIKGKR